MKIGYNVDEINIEQWKLLEDNAKLTNVFQTKKYYDFLLTQNYLDVFLFFVEEQGVLNGIIIGYIQKDGNKITQYLSKRAIVLGGPLLSDNISDSALVALLVECKKKLESEAIYIETRNFNDYSKYRALFSQCGFNYSPHLNFYIDCSSFEIFNKNLSRNIKRNVKSALAEGVEIVTEVTISDINAFYKILHDTYRYQIKSPLFPLSFFQNLHEQPFSKYIIIKYNEEIIGGMCLLFAAKTVYAYYVCGKDDIYIKCYPSTVANYQSILFAVENGFERFDFMGAGKPNEEYGVRDFKAKFGGELVEHGRFLCIMNPILYKIGKLGVKLLKKI